MIHIIHIKWTILTSPFRRHDQESWFSGLSLGGHSLHVPSCFANLAKQVGWVNAGWGGKW